MIVQGFRGKWDISPPLPPYIKNVVETSPMIAHLLHHRGCITPDEIDNFLEKDNSFHDPFLFEDMREVVSIINNAIKMKEKIAVYADLDCDGISSAAIMNDILRSMDADFEIYLPSRSEGHGMTMESIQKLYENGAKVLLTVDTGITAVEEVRFAQSLGMKVAITDHHIPDEILPSCPVINPHRPGSIYPFTGLSGAGVALKLAQALAGTDCLSLTDFAALGTIGDVVSLRGENRTIVSIGLKTMIERRRPGFMSLIAMSGANPQTLNANTVAFYIVPKINVANRMAHPQLAFDALTAEDRTVANKLVKELDMYNETRKTLLREYTEEAIEMCGSPETFHDKVKNGEEYPIIIAQGKWQSGISGLVASRLAETYCVPAIVCSTDGEKITGSARTYGNVNVTSLIYQGKNLILGGGGHTGAAGFSVEISQAPKFFQVIREAAREMQTEEINGPTFRVDARVSLSQVNMYSIKQLSKLEPFGKEFEEPVFALEGVYLKDKKLVGSGKNHLSAIVSDGKKEIKGIMFSHDKELEEINEDSKFDLIFSMEENSFKGISSPQIRIKDWKLSELEI